MEGAPADGPGEPVAANNLARIDELVNLGYIDTEFTGEVLTEFFDGIAERRGKDHWKLSAAKRDRMARPITAVLNGWIEFLLSGLPDSLASRVGDHPEYIASLAAVGTVAVPMCLKDAMTSSGDPKAKKVVVVKSNGRTVAAVSIVPESTDRIE